MRVEVPAATRHTVEDLLAGGGDGEGGDGEGEGVRSSAREAAIFFGGGQTSRPTVEVKKMPSFFDAEGVRSGRSRAGSGRRVASRRGRGRRGTPRDASFLRERVEVRVVASRDARREVRRITRLRSIGRQSRLGAVATERARALAGNEEEDALRTWTWKTAPCGWTCGFGRNGGDGRGQLRVAKRAPRGGARPMRDVGIVR